MLLALGMSVISFYYYLKVLKQAYVAEPMAGAGNIRVPVTARIALWATAALVVLLGCLPALLMNRIATALPSAFH